MSHDLTKPNILLLFTDQHRADLMNCAGSVDIRTPNLDRLAARGVRFTQARCQDAVCLPSRASMMTGLYPRTLGLLDNEDHDYLAENPVTAKAVPLQLYLKRAGYRTGAFGKRHLPQNSIDSGWDVLGGHHWGCDAYPGSGDTYSYTRWLIEDEQGVPRPDAFENLCRFYDDWGAEHGSTTVKDPAGVQEDYVSLTQSDLATRVSAMSPDRTMEAFTAQKSMQFIREAADGNSPFFLWSSFYRPHQPYTPQKKWMDGFDTSEWGPGMKKGKRLVSRPESLDQPEEDLPPFIRIMRKGTQKPWNMKDSAENESLWRNYIAAYYAHMEEIDHYMGEILDTLEETGQLENTIIIYTADHGEFVGNHGLVEKMCWWHSMYRETIEVPLIVSVPDRFTAPQRKGAVSDELAELVDLFPTITDILKEPFKQEPLPLAGKSLLSLLQGPDSGSHREYTFTENWSMSAVCDKRFTLGYWTDPVHPEKRDGSILRDYRPDGKGDLKGEHYLFDRLNDRSEMVNLFEKQPDTVRKMLKALEDKWAAIPDDGREYVLRHQKTEKEKESLIK